MKVLVIGGTLFIGKLLVEELLKEGHDVAVLHRKAKHDFGRRVENIQADRNDPAAMKEALSGRRYEVVMTTCMTGNAARPRLRSRGRSARSATVFPGTFSCPAWPPTAMG